MYLQAPNNPGIFIYGIPGSFSRLPPSGVPTYFLRNWAGFFSHYLHSDTSCYRCTSNFRVESSTEKLLRKFYHLSHKRYRCTRKVTQIFYTVQEPMFKPLSFCQPTEAATVRRIRKGETSPLRRLLLLAFWRSKRLTRRAGAEPRKNSVVWARKSTNKKPGLLGDKRFQSLTVRISLPVMSQLNATSRKFKAVKIYI